MSAIVIEVMLYVKMAFTREAEDTKEVSVNKFCHHEAFPAFLPHTSLPSLNCCVFLKLVHDLILDLL